MNMIGFSYFSDFSDLFQEHLQKKIGIVQLTFTSLEDDRVQGNIL